MFRKHEPQRYRQLKINPTLYEVVLKSTYSRLEDLSSDELKEIRDALKNQ